MHLSEKREHDQIPIQQDSYFGWLIWKYMETIEKTQQMFAGNLRQMGSKWKDMFESHIKICIDWTSISNACPVNLFSI